MRNAAPPDPARTQRSTQSAGEIRSLAPGLLLGAAVAFYLGFSWAVDWPTAVPVAEQEAWKQADQWFIILLRAGGVVFLVAAGLCATGRGYAAAIAAGAEGFLGALFLVMAADGFLEGRAAGGMDAFSFILAALGVFSLYHVRGAWQLRFANAGRAGEPA